MDLNVDDRLQGSLCLIFFSPDVRYVRLKTRSLILGEAFLATWSYTPQYYLIGR